MMWPDLERVLTAARFAEIVEAESKRTLYVQPAQLDRARWLVEQAGADRLVTVRQHPFLAPGMWLLVDELAVEAGWREMRQETREAFRFDEPGPYYIPPPRNPYDPLGGWL